VITPLKVRSVSLGKHGLDTINGDSCPVIGVWEDLFVLVLFAESILALLPMIFAVVVSDSSISPSISPASQNLFV